MNRQDPNPRGMTRNPDHDTSERAAGRLKHRTLRQLVLHVAENWPEGFTDEEMDAQCRRHEPDLDRAESSYRKRRTELSDDFVIVDSGTKRAKRNGEEAKVWVHRKFHPDPPPEVVKPKGERSQALARRKQASIQWNALVDCAYGRLAENAGRAVAEALGIDYPIRPTEIPAKRPL